MTAAEQRAQRKRLNVLHGEERFDDARIQAELGFSKSGSTIVDRLIVPAFEYDLRSRAGRAFFYDGAFETGEIALAARLLADNSAPVIVEAEAGIGAQAVTLGRVLGRGRIFAFEPELETRAYLERNVSRAKLDGCVTVVPQALGGEHTYAAFGGTPVEVVTLDDFVRERRLDALALLRVDVPGRERAIVASARTTLSELRPVVLLSLAGELSLDEDGARTIAEIVALGYRPYVSLEGYAIPYARYRPELRNYLFVDERSDVRPERSADPEHLLEAAAALIALAERQAEQIGALENATDAGEGFSGTLVEELRTANLQLEETLRQRDADIAMLVESAQTDPAELEGLRTIAQERAQAIELLEETLRRLPG